jgi:hypothetical protein
MGETKIDLTSDEVIIIGGVLEMRGKSIILCHICLKFTPNLFLIKIKL